MSQGYLCDIFLMDQLRKSKKDASKDKKLNHITFAIIKDYSADGSINFLRTNFC